MFTALTALVREAVRGGRINRLRGIIDVKVASGRAFY
jgi:hypothetical protein